MSAIFFHEIRLATEEKTRTSRAIGPLFRRGERVIAFIVLIVVIQDLVVDLRPLSSFVFATTHAIHRSRKRTRNVGGIVFRIRVMSRPTRRQRFRDENR